MLSRRLKALVMPTIHVSARSYRDREAGDHDGGPSETMIAAMSVCYHELRRRAGVVARRRVRPARTSAPAPTRSGRTGPSGGGRRPRRRTGRNRVAAEERDRRVVPAVERWAVPSSRAGAPAARTRGVSAAESARRSGGSKRFSSRSAGDGGSQYHRISLNLSARGPLGYRIKRRREAIKESRDGVADEKSSAAPRLLSKRSHPKPLRSLPPPPATRLHKRLKARATPARRSPRKLVHTPRSRQKRSAPCGRCGP